VPVVRWRHGADAADGSMGRWVDGSMGRWAVVVIVWCMVLSGVESIRIGAGMAQSSLTTRVIWTDVL
jgi:hypothetical protein